MSKYKVDSEEELIIVKTNFLLKAGDIIVHKPLTFAKITGAFRNLFTSAELIPVEPGTDCYTINGSNTSVIKTIGTSK